MFFTVIIQVFAMQYAVAGSKPEYKIANISKELKKGASSVIRNSELIYEVTSKSSAVYSVKKVISILNKSALEDATLVQYYDKFSKVKKAKVVVYDEFGNEVKKLKYDDIKDFSAVDGGTVFSDARVKLIDPEYQTIPFTVEVVYEIVYSGIVGTPIWSYYPGYETSIEKSSLTVISSESNPIRYYQVNTKMEPTKTKEGDDLILKWEVSNLPAIKWECFSSTFYENTPTIFTAPSFLVVSGYIGNARSWDKLGEWISVLNEGRSELPEETVTELKSLLSDSLSEKETIKMLYEWMQDKTRYVSIQIGIGGWQPIDAKDVDKYSYGDCKALTNYMHAILKVADIKSYYTLVRAGSRTRNIIADFPSNQFNHAILCVPVDNDTIWLECTSQTNPFGYLGTFTDDRDVLVIGDDGGVLVRTPLYGEEENRLVTKAVVNFDSYGDGSANIKMCNTGIYYDDRLPVVSYPEKRQKEFIIDNIDIPSFELTDYSFHLTKNEIPVIEEDLDLRIKSYVSKIGTRLFFEINLINKYKYNFRRSKIRRNEIVIRRSRMETDTVIYQIPAGYKVEAIPEAIFLQADFGHYITDVLVEDDSITYVRNFKINKGNYNKEKYIDFKKFINNISSSDNQKVVLVSEN